MSGTGQLHPAYFETRFRTEAPVADWPVTFAIISACAPTGEARDAALEAVDDARLRALLEARGVWHCRITGYSPVTGHAEASWAAEVSVEEGREVGRGFGQDAVYYVSEGALFVTSCDPKAGLVLVGPLRPRLDAALREGDDGEG